MEETTEKSYKRWKPLVHFFLLGLVVFGLKAWFERPATVPKDVRLIEISSSDIAWYRSMFSKHMGREPFAEEIQDQIDRLIREEILSREAVKLGLDKKDEVIRRRLAQKMDYLFRDMASGIQPNTGDLEMYLNANLDRYRISGTTSFDQVYFNTRNRGATEAEQAAERFILNPIGPGDPTLLPETMIYATDDIVIGTFGSEFKDTLYQADTGQWFKAKSSFGIHAVYIHDQSAAHLPSIESIHAELTADWSVEKQAELSAEAYKAALKSYTIILEGMPYDTGL